MKSVVFLCIVSLFILPSFVFAQLGEDDEPEQPDWVDAPNFVDGLVLYHPYNEGEGSIAEDTSDHGINRRGYKHDGEISNPMWVDGKFGKALEFGGENSGTFVTVEHHPKLNLNQCSFMAWINAEHWNGTRQIVGKSVHGGCSGRAQYGLFSEDGLLKLRFETEAGSVELTTDLPDTGTFVHVAFTNDGSTARLYIDSEQVVEAEVGGALITNDDLWHVGKDCGHDNYIFAGIIDEVRLWNRALSAEEIGVYWDKGVLLFYAARKVKKLSQVWGEIRADR